MRTGYVCEKTVSRADFNSSLNKVADKTKPNNYSIVTHNVYVHSLHSIKHFFQYQ